MYIVNRSYVATGSVARGGEKTAKPGKWKVCSIFGGVIIPDSCKLAGDARPEFILLFAQVQNKVVGAISGSTSSSSQYHIHHVYSVILLPYR